MSTEIDKVNQKLYRPLLHGIQYNNLMPAYLGIEKAFDKPNQSNVFDQMHFMSQWVKKYANQMQKVAPLLKGETVKQTANNIYQFLYNHYQYSLDGDYQQIVAPSAAWKFRNKGFDCKTFSTLASCILTVLKMPHAFRMVKQKEVYNGNWSHVYVIVYDKQNYHAIDATIHQNVEVEFTNKHDYQMQNFGLAYPHTKASNCGCKSKKLGNAFSLQPAGISGGFGGFSSVPVIPISGTTPTATPTFWQSAGAQIGNINIEGVNVGDTINTIGSGDFGQITNVFNQVSGGLSDSNTALSAYAQYLPDAINVGANIVSGNWVQAGVGLFSMVKNLFKNLSCIGGTAFNEGDYKKMIDQGTAYYVAKVAAINTAISTKNLLQLSDLITEYRASSQLGIGARDRAFAANNWNSCTDKNFNEIRHFWWFYMFVLGKALDIYLDAFFTKQSNPKGKTKFGLLEVFPEINWVHSAAFHDHIEPSFGYVPRPNVRIPNFMITQYILDNLMNVDAITAKGYLQSLIDSPEVVLVLDSTQVQTTPTIATSSPNGQQQTNNLPKEKIVKQAGMGTVPMILMSALALGTIYKATKN